MKIMIHGGTKPINHAVSSESRAGDEFPSKLDPILVEHVADLLKVHRLPKSDLETFKADEHSSHIRWSRIFLSQPIENDIVSILP